MSSSPPPIFSAQKLHLQSPTQTSSSLLYDPHSHSLALPHSDSSFSLYPSFYPLSLPPPKSLISSPISSATFLHIQTTPNSSSSTTIFLVSSPLLRPSSATLLRFYILRNNRFDKTRVVSNHRDLEFDERMLGVVFRVNHGVKMRLEGGVNVFGMYSASECRIWVFAVRLIVGDGGESLKLMKCAVIDCCFPVFEIRVLFGFLVLGEENGVRVFLLRTMVKGSRGKEKKSSGKRLNVKNGDLNVLNVRSEKNSDSGEFSCSLMC